MTDHTPSALPPEVHSRLLGATGHALGRSQANAVTRLRAQPPRPPVWKRKELLAPAVAALVLLSVMGMEIYMRVQISLNESRLDELETEFNRKLRIKKAADSTASQALSLEQQIAEKQQLVEKEGQKAKGLQRLVDRRDLLPDMLQQVAEAVTDEVLIDRISQSKKDETRFYVAGWAMTNTAAQLFVNNLGKLLKPWNMQVQDSRILSGRNRMGSEGYTVEAWLRVQEGKS